VFIQSFVVVESIDKMLLMRVSVKELVGVAWLVLVIYNVALFINRAVVFTT